MKPKVRDHYHSHRLSFWLNLIPKLHQPGDEQVYLRHHLLSDHENALSYDGVVRQIAFKFLTPFPTKTAQIHLTSTAPKLPTFTTTHSALDMTPTAITNPGIVSTVSPNKSTAAVVMQQSGYSTALSVTIAIGCSLLILNMLIFAGVYYQLDKAKSKDSNEHEHCHHHQQHNDVSIDLSCHATLLLP